MQFTISDLTVSDLFFNSKEAEAIDYTMESLRTEVTKAAQEWLDNYPEFGHDNLEWLIDNFINRL